MLDILTTMDGWLNEGRPTALATVVATWGSSPRQAGAKLGIAADMAMIGSVSGGCVENAVVEEALAGLKDNKPRLLNFGVSDDTAWDVGLACGGRMTVYVEPLDTKWWQIAASHARRDQAMATATIMTGELAGQKASFDETGLVYATSAITPELCDQISQQGLLSRSSGRMQIGDFDILVDVYRPRPRLILIGGAHVAMALNNFALQLGFRVILIDPRKAFATPERFPDVELISHRYPDKALAEIGITPESYIAILTHDPKIDDPALRIALPSSAPYIGVLSSKRTHEKRIERLTEAGVAPELLARIRTPIGINIGAQTPEEIALCIMAEIIAVRNKVLA
jgi:xanthine dehydrogenase accessory factor